MLLSSARRAYNEKNYSFAAGKFKEFLGRYGNHKEAGSARYGLALCLIEGPDKDYNAAIEQLQACVNNKEFPEHAKALYYLGLSQRGFGIKELAQADARPQEAVQRQAAARQRFEQAAKQFETAVAEFTSNAKAPAAGRGAASRSIRGAAGTDRRHYGRRPSSGYQPASVLRPGPSRDAGAN